MYNARQRNGILQNRKQEGSPCVCVVSDLVEDLEVHLRRIGALRGRTLARQFVPGVCWGPGTERTTSPDIQPDSTSPMVGKLGAGVPLAPSSASAGATSRPPVAAGATDRSRDAVPAEVEATGRSGCTAGVAGRLGMLGRGREGSAGGGAGVAGARLPPSLSVRVGVEGAGEAEAEAPCRGLTAPGVPSTARDGVEGPASAPVSLIRFGLRSASGAAADGGGREPGRGSDSKGGRGGARSRQRRSM